MPNKSYRVLVTKEQLTFSAAHFITFGDNICESLHGHNYGVRCEIEGALNEHGFVADFIAVRDQLARITGNMDHKVLLPAHHPSIEVQQNCKEVVARFEERRWVFPNSDCLIVPVANTTAELLASYISDQMIQPSPDWLIDGLTRLIVGVDENQGQWGYCDRNLNL